METSDEEPIPESSDLEDAIFDTAVHIEDPEERRVYLERSFHGDPDGLARMTELLELAGESAAFFIETRKHRDLLAEDTLMAMREDEFSRDAVSIAEDEPGSTIGRYRVIGRIGSGGGGIVYEAEQQEPVVRRVALKVIRLGMDTETVISRFEVERQALALMDHPNIARVLDAGATASGRPYFVMELVKGDRITSYCDEEKLDVTERLKLFIQVCHAIQHAHQKGIIHRDIKPSNILMATHDGLAQPKVIDFGIAKATENRLPSAAMSTAMDQPVGTPAYMSPEQADMGGIDVDTRSDVYGLGALLYELIAGRPPFDGEALLKSGMSEMRRTLLEKDPLLPSAALLAAEDGGEIAKLRCSEKNRLVSVLAGDLDWIVMKALEKDRNRRYQTANSLAMDVQRYLTDEPVIARRPSRLYLLGKFVRRHRVACISGAAVAISLIGGMSAATVLYLREREALVEQERLRAEAEKARAEEVRLRDQAQARANISRVAVLLSEGEIEEADSLLQQNPLASIDPSREAANVYRSLGSWYAVYGRWEQAVQCFALLRQANRLDKRRSIVEGLDLLYTGPAYLEYQDARGYDEFRREVVELYLPARNTIEAEHLLKVCLLAPATPKMLADLKQVADMCSGVIQPFPDSKNFTTFPEWEAFSMALYHYRMGEHEKCLEWSAKSRKIADKVGSRNASLLCLTAMSKRALGKTEEAKAELKKAKEMIPAPPDPADDAARPLPGTWFSWSVARILLREAEGR